MRRRDLTFHGLLAAAAVTAAYLFFYTFLRTPTAQLGAGGLAQKIFYFHVPAAYGMYLAGAVCFIASAGYLLDAKDSRDAWARAGAEVAVLCGVLVLTTGPLWAKKAWGVYWTWDPRLTTSLLSVLVYTAVVVLRTFAGDGEAERKFAAALGVLGTVNLPIIHYSVQKWTGNHPKVISSGGGGLKDPAMVHALIVGFVALTLLVVVLMWLRARLALSQHRLARAEERAGAAGLIEEA